MVDGAKVRIVAVDVRRAGRCDFLDIPIVGFLLRFFRGIAGVGIGIRITADVLTSAAGSYGNNEQGNPEGKKKSGTPHHRGNTGTDYRQVKHQGGMGRLPAHVHAADPSGLAGEAAWCVVPATGARGRGHAVGLAGSGAGAPRGRDAAPSLHVAAGVRVRIPGLYPAGQSIQRAPEQKPPAAAHAGAVSSSQSAGTSVCQSAGTSGGTSAGVSGGTSEGSTTTSVASGHSEQHEQVRTSTGTSSHRPKQPPQLVPQPQEQSKHCMTSQSRSGPGSTLPAPVT